jgi:hypothetical protein
MNNIVFVIVYGLIILGAMFFAGWLIYIGHPGYLWFPGIIALCVGGDEDKL